MNIKSNTLIAVRSNCDFSLDYETSNLTPKSEIILITTSPKYVLDKKRNGFNKEIEIHEFRFHAYPEGLNKLIGELQLVLQNMNAFEQTAASFNLVIESQKSKLEKKKDV